MTDLRVDRIKHDANEKRLEREAERRRLKKDTARDVANYIGTPKNPERREKAEASFISFAQTYFSELFPLKFSQVHIDVINRLEETVNKGALYCCACPRGFGKTTIAKIGVLWAVLTGRSKFAVLIANNAGRAQLLCDDLLKILSSNVLLAEDFPEATVPFRLCDGSPRRLLSMTYEGESLLANTSKGRILMPRIKGSKSSESVIVTTGLTGSVRGLSQITSTGKALRPDLVLCDDIEDAESAMSPTQTEGRYAILMSDVLGLAGANGIACLITATVIAPDDLTEKMLNNPEFHGHRYKLVTSFPKNMALWDEWNEIRINDLKNGGYGEPATEFYKENFEEMHEGASVSWDDRYNPRNDVDALEAAMKLYYRDAISFYSEYQNDPQKLNEDTAYVITREKFGLACSGEKKLICPHEAEFITSFIDVHKNLLYYCTVAYDRKFNGAIIDYGSFPRQRRKQYTLKNPGIALEQYFSNASLESCITQGLNNLCDYILNTTYVTESGEEVPVKRVAIDANWGDQTDTVYSFIRGYKNDKVIPSHGKFVGVTGSFMQGGVREDWVGTHWRVPKKRSKGLRYLLIDTNYWKSFLYNRISAPLGTVGRMTVYGQPSDHPLLQKHLSSEFATEVMAKEHRMLVWELYPGQDNHLLDCLVGTCVLANIEGAEYMDIATATRKRNQKRAMAYKSLRRVDSET